MSREPLSSDSIRAATENKTEFSGHGSAMGIAGYKDPGRPAHEPDRYLTSIGDARSLASDLGTEQTLRVSLSWSSAPSPVKTGFFSWLRRAPAPATHDLDLGCFYELQDGTRGVIQALGGLFGAAAEPPFIRHTGDERTGARPGPDESLLVEGAYWPKIRRMMVYAYVYEGPCDWSKVAPILIVNTGRERMEVIPAASTQARPLCAVAMLENRENGLYCTNLSEYYGSHPEMDRAFGFGIAWEEGTKND